MVSFQFALNFVSILYKGPCSTFWRVFNGAKYFFFFGMVCISKCWTDSHTWYLTYEYSNKDIIINSKPNADISDILCLCFKFSSCVFKHVTQGLKSEFCKHGKKSGFGAKLTFCYFCIPSSEVNHFNCYSVQNVIFGYW